MTVLCPRVYVRPSFHQRPREFDIAVLSRGVERRPASVLPRVDAGPMIEQAALAASANEAWALLASVALLGLLLIPFAGPWRQRTDV